MHAIKIQKASYLKMCSPTFEPKNSSDKTTEPITMKFGMNDHFTNLNNIIEAFFQIPPLGRVTRPQRGGPKGQNWPKIFFRYFHLF